MAQSLSQWLSYIESLHPKNIELGLDRVSLVAKSLNVFPDTAKVLTIAGTNGKGSCAALLSAILQEAGYHTVVYTSPHLLRFNERIQINGVEASDEAIVQALEAIEKARGDVELTYFEFTTLAAFYLFKQSSLDIWILEVGLGGRLDAVNIIDPDIAIISTIALDHMDWLGQDREAIGAEKAGIIRTQIPVICGDLNPPASLIAAAEHHRARLYIQGKDFSYQQDASGWSFTSEEQTYKALPLPQLPIQNAATVLMALQLSDFVINETALHKGIQKACLKGRFQIISTPVQTILDVAHNPESSAYLAERLKGKACEGKTRAVVGMLSDKDIQNTLIPLISCVDEWYIADLDVLRAENAENLANYLHKLGVTAYHVVASVAAAYQDAIQASDELDRVVVFGSFYTVADVLNETQRER